jgi:glycosyltransferase involved in cell wall biosynthesis
VRSAVLNEIRDAGAVLGRLSLTLPQFIVANSEPAIGTALAEGVRRERLYLLPNAVDTVHYRPACAGPLRTEFRILSVGRLVKYKRYDRLLRVLARVRTMTSRPVRAVLAGSGPLEGELKAQAAELGLHEGLVQFSGSADDPAGLYGEADLFVLTSDCEGTPNVILEAMSCGLPVVATAAGGVPGLVRHGLTGRLVSTADEDGLASAITSLIEQPGLRRAYGARAREFVVENHSLERLPGRLERLYVAMTGASREPQYA